MWNPISELSLEPIFAMLAYTSAICMTVFELNYLHIYKFNVYIFIYSTLALSEKGQ